MQGFSKNHIRKLGDIIRNNSVDSEEYRTAISELNQWRKDHISLMDEYYDKACELTKTLKLENPFVTERLKRMPTIIDKLDRFPDMDLSRMRDIGGIRIVVENMNELLDVEKSIMKWNDLKSPVIDYITRPRESGYRGKHFVFERDGMFIELQLRTRMQHVWATAVETVDIFAGTALKTRGANDFWQDFFKLTSAAFSHFENTPTIDAYTGLTISNICQKLSEVMNVNHIEPKLKGYALTELVDKRPFKDAYFAVLSLNGFGVDIYYYSEQNFQEAAEKYEELEMKTSKGNNVLVSVSDLNKLKEAYPNYFLDLRKFVNWIDIILEKYQDNA